MPPTNKCRLEIDAALGIQNINRCHPKINAASQVYFIAKIMTKNFFDPKKYLEAKLRQKISQNVYFLTKNDPKNIFQNFLKIFLKFFS